MTPQNVIKSFVARLANHGYTAGNVNGMLDSAVRASSRYTSIDEVISSIQADHLQAEQISIETVVNYYLGEDAFNSYCVEGDAVKPLSEISNEILDYECADNITIGDLIRETTAQFFLKNYCGIDLNNDDTGAITGSDANLTITANMLGSNGEQVLQVLSEYYGDEAALSDDGQTLIIGTGVTKTAEDIIPENFNTYTASNNAAQVIDTGTKGWLVKATNKNDTIISNGADSIDAGAGNDVITVNANGSTVASGTGNDKITVSASVKTVKLTDLSDKDELTILGNFEVGSAQVEDMMLTITDKTGTRKITLAQFQAATKVNVGNASTTLGEWLADKANWDWSTASETENTGVASSATFNINLDDVTADSSGTVTFEGFAAGKLSNSSANVSTFTSHGLTVHLRGQASDIRLSNIIPLTLDDLDDDQKIILAGLFKWWVKEALALNEESYGLSFGDNATVHDIDLCFFYDENGSLAAILPKARADLDGVATALYLNVNLEPYQNISADNVNGNSNGWGYLDRTLAHEFNHAVFNANINYFNGLPTFIKEGFAELVQGVDDDQQNAILRVARNTDSLAAQLDLTNNTTQNVTTDTYAAGYVFLRYFAKQAALQTIYFPSFSEIAPVTVNFNNLNVSANSVLYVDTSAFDPTVQVAKDLDTFNGLDDPNNSLLAVGQILDLGNGVLYYSVDNDLVKQNITLGGKITNVYQLNANTNLTGSEGADAIQIVEGSNSINGGGGADYLEVTGQYASINTGAGDDSIILFDGGHNNINLGDGDNYLELDGEPFLGYGYIYSELYGNTITGGAGNDTVLNLAYRYFDDDGYEVTPDTEDATAYDFYGYQFDSTVDLGDGDNEVHLTSLVDSSVKTGAGNDVISITVLKNSTLNTGAGNDIIGFHGSGNSVDAGAGENVIVAYNGSANTIKTSAGSDYISVGAEVEDFTVEGFGTDDMIILEQAPAELEITDGKLIAGNATVTSISSIATSETSWLTRSDRISYKRDMTPGAVLNGNEITYSEESGREYFFTVMNLNSAEGVSIDGSDVILTEAALANRTANTISISGGDYNLKLDGAINGTLTLADAQAATFSDGTYTAAITTETFTEDDGAITYHKATGGQQFTITGLKADAKLDRDIFVGEDGKVTVKASALPQATEGATVVLTDLKAGDGVNYTLTFDEEIAQDTSTHKGGWSGSNGTFTFTEDYKLTHWAKNGNTYTFHNQTGGHKFTLSGLDSDVTADNLTTKNIAVTGNSTNGYTVKILNSAVLPTTNAVTVKGISGVEGIAAANYTLALDSKVAAPKTIAESFINKSGKYTYTATGTSAGWSVADGKIVYSAQVGGDQFTLSGIKNGVKLNSGVTVANNVVKVSSDALNSSEKDGAKILLTDNNNKYTLRLDTDILQAATVVKGAFTSVSGGKAIYTATHNLSYYEPTEANVYTYRKQDAAKKITIGNLKKTATIDDIDALTITETGGKFAVSFNDDKILDSKSPSISADKGVTYEVTVADKLNPAKLDADWLVRSTNASLKSDTSAGYTVKSNKVVYSGRQTGKPQAVLSGLQKNVNPAVPAADVLTLKAADLGAKTTLKSNADNFTVELTGDTAGKRFYGTNGNDTLKVSATNAFVDGGKGNDEFTITGAAASVLGGAGNDKFIITGAAASVLGGAGNDEFTITGGDVTLSGGAGADTFNVGSNGAVLTYTKGDGADTVNYAKGLKISLNGSMKPISIAKDSGNLILNLGKNDSITVTDIGDTLAVFNKTENLSLDMSKINHDNNFTFDAKSNAVTVASTFRGTVTAEDDIYLNNGKLSKVSTIDAGNVTGEVLIVGNSKANTLLGGKGKTSLAGGKGNDVFIYNGGELTITDYGDGADKISVGSYISSGFSVDGGDVVIDFGNRNSMRLKDSAGKAITFVAGKSSAASIYTADGVFNGGKTAVTLTGTNGDLSGESKIATITADDTFKGAEIIGNDKANIINGGDKGESLKGNAGNDKLFGNGGADTLWGGAGNDLFVFDGRGADVIMDYGVGADKVSLDTDMTIVDASVVDKDVTLKFTSGDPLKLMGIGDKTVAFVETSISTKGKKVGQNVSYAFGDGKIFNGGKTAVTLTGANGDLSGESKIATITADDTFKGAEIIGNDKANIINGGDKGESLKGNAGNDKLFGNGGADTLWGGAGNDTLYGGTGVDTFIYKPGDGKDTIMDYESGELLTITDSTFKSASFSKNTLTLAIDGGGSITFKNVTDTTNFNINGTTYRVSGKTLE